MNSFFLPKTMVSALPGAARRGFSLVELLTVVAMLSILLAMAVPSLVNRHNASVLATSGNTIADLTTLARQNAISRRAITALIIRPKTSVPSGKQSVTVVEYEFSEKAWKRSHQWIRLAENVELQDESDNAGAAALGAIAALQLDDGGTTVHENEYSALVFYPDGRMASIGKPTRRLRIALAHGEKVNTYDLVFNVDTSAYRVVRP